MRKKALIALMVVGALTKDLDLFGSELDDATEKLKEDAKQAALADQANAAFAKTLDGVEQALRRNEDALKDQADGYRSVAEKAELAALARADHPHGPGVRLRSRCAGP